MGSCNSSGKGNSIFDFGAEGTDAKIIPDLPARMNKLYNGNRMSVQHTMETFEKEHANSTSEHLIALDDDGFVSTYQHGGKHSVGFTLNQVEGKHIVHNHPSGSHFSHTDLENLSTTGMKGVTATSKSGYRYTATKTQKFNGTEWQKALSQAKTGKEIKTMDDYNNALHNWMSRNALKYGVEYTRTKI